MRDVVQLPRRSSRQLKALSITAPHLPDRGRLTSSQGGICARWRRAL